MVWAAPKEPEATIAMDFKLKLKKIMGGGWCMALCFQKIFDELKSFWSFKMRMEKREHRQTSTTMPDKLTQTITRLGI